MADTGIGETLRAAREESGVAIEDVARQTKVRVDYLHALEAEQFDRMGGDVYAKGFLKTYAQALGLEPESLLAIYKRRVQGDTGERLSGSLAAAPVAREPRGAPPMWLVWAIAAIVVLVGVGAVASLVGGRSPEPAEQPRPPVAATPTPTDQDTPTPTPTPDPTPSFDGVNLVLTFESDSWVRINVDGTVVREEVVRAGQELTFDGNGLIVVRFGNAGGVRVTVNGVDYGLVGEPGRVETREYTQDGPRQDAT